MNDPDPIPPGFDLSEWQSKPTPATAGLPRWILDQRGDVWARWVSDDMFHQGSRTASLADVVKHYGPVQVLTLSAVITEADDGT